MNKKISINFYEVNMLKIKNAGFTLAEVLITLGIIGIVAAMTLPTVITKYQKQETVTKLKKVYTILSQAVAMSEVSNGPCEYWDYSLLSAAFFDKYLKPYLPTIVNSRYGNIMNEVKYMRTNGTIENSFTLFRDDAMIVSLKDGTVFYMTSNSGGYVAPNGSGNREKGLCFDINGFKKPNVIGRDFFCLMVSKKYKVIPYGAYNSTDIPMGEFTRENAQSGSYGCSRQGRGQFCSALIMLDGWEIKDDYPW